MSNTKKTRWTAAEITAANAEAALAEFAAAVAVDDDPKTRAMLLEIWDELDAQGRADEFPEMAGQIRAQAARTVVMRNLIADSGAAADPAIVAALEQAAADLGDDYWERAYREMTGGG
jgi:hypothetical protein